MTDAVKKLAAEAAAMANRSQAFDRASGYAQKTLKLWRRWQKNDEPIGIYLCAAVILSQSLAEQLGAEHGVDASDVLVKASLECFALQEALGDNDAP